jgi:hypothetical protein
LHNFSWPTQRGTLHLRWNLSMEIQE